MADLTLEQLKQQRDAMKTQLEHTPDAGKVAVAKQLSNLEREIRDKEAEQAKANEPKKSKPQYVEWEMPELPAFGGLGGSTGKEADTKESDFGLVGDAVKLPKKPKGNKFSGETDEQAVARESKIETMQSAGPTGIPLKPELTVGAWTGEDESAEDTGTTEDTGKADEPPPPPTKPPTIEEQKARLNQEWEGREKEFDQTGEDLDKQFSQAIKEIKGMYSAMQDEVEKKRMWEQLINGLGHLAAGIVGMQTGLNLGGLKFDKRDWDKEKDRLMREMNSAKEDMYRNLNTQQRTLANKRAKAYRSYQLKRDDIQQAFNNAVTKKKLVQDQLDYQIRKAAALAKGAPDKKSLEKMADRLQADVIQMSNNEDVDFDMLQSMADAANAAAERAGQPIPFGKLKKVPGYLWGERAPKARERFEQLIPGMGGAAAPTSANQPPAGKVLMIAPNGQQGYVAEGEVKRLEGLGYKRG